MRMLTTIKQMAQIGYYTHGMIYRNRCDQRANERIQMKQYEDALLVMRDDLAITKLHQMEIKFAEDKKWNNLTLDQRLKKAIKEAEAEMFLNPDKFVPTLPQQNEPPSGVSSLLAIGVGALVGLMILFMMLASCLH